MAGIGFELRKLFKGTGSFRLIRAVCISTAVTVAPMLLTVLMMLALQWYMGYQGVSFATREQFMLHVYYAMVFSYIITSFICQPLTRYVSDRLFDKQPDRILPSAHGSVCTFLVIGIPVSVFYILLNDTNTIYELLTVGLFHTMGVIWLEMVYLSAVRCYQNIFFGFCFSGIVTVALGIALIKLKLDPVASCLLSAQIGFGVMSFWFMKIIQKEFPSNKGNSLHFFTAFASYPQLILSGFFVSSGAFLHCLIMWMSDGAISIGKLMWYTPSYDIPAFLAFITLIPLFVRFNVVVEVHFSERYHRFYDLIDTGGIYTDIKLAHKEMIDISHRELNVLAEIQGLIVLFFITLAVMLFPSWLLLPTCIPTFRFLTLGYYAYGMMQVVTILLLYFDDRKGALGVSCLFFILSGGLSLAFLPMGSEYYGAGFFCAGILSVVVCMARFEYYTKQLCYYTFCSQPMFTPRTRGISKIMSRVLLKIAEY